MIIVMSAGLAVAFDRFEIAIVLCFLNFITLFVAGHFKNKLKEDDKSK